MPHPPLSPPFFFYSYGDHRDLHSFATRRSSDLAASERVSGLRRRRSHQNPMAAPGRTPTSAPRPIANWFTLYPDAMTSWQLDRKSTSELQSQSNLVCRLLLEKKKKNQHIHD